MASNIIERGDTIGARLARLRETNGQTQQQVADAVGVKRETINQWESNTRDMKTAAISAVAQHFNVTADYLLGLSAVRKPEPTLQAACEYTGLSEAAIEAVRGIVGESHLFLDSLLHSSGFDEFLCCAIAFGRFHEASNYDSNQSLQFETTLGGQSLELTAQNLVDAYGFGLVERLKPLLAEAHSGMLDAQFRLLARISPEGASALKSIIEGGAEHGGNK